MASLAFILLLLWISLTLVLWFGGAWLQDFLYSEPAAQLYWRAPLAALLLVLWVGFWCQLDYRHPGRYPAPYDFSATERKSFDELWSVREGKKVQYKRSAASKGGLGGRTEYKETAFPYRTWSRSESVIVQEDGNEVTFEAERDQDRNYKVQTGRDLRYIDAKGRVMTEGNLGQLYLFRWGTFLTYTFLNLVLLMVWFAVLWLLIRFQWSHALGLAALFWLASVLLFVPMMLAKVEEAARTQSAPPARTSSLLAPSESAGCAPWA